MMCGRKTIHVAAAILRSGNKIFATQRGCGEFKGGWEFPGGKIEPGETPQQALVREIREELDTEIEVGGLVERVEYDYPAFHLSMDCFWCTVRSGRLELKEHQAAKWLAGEELDSVDWLPADLGLIDKLKGLLCMESVNGQSKTEWRMGIMSEARDNLLTRRSIRKYKPDMVPEAVIERIVEAGTYAATGMGKQSPIIIAVTNRELRDRLSGMNARIMGSPGTDPFYGAPVVLIVLADRTRPTYIYDGSLVMGNLMLAAHAEGIGSCWIHRAREEFDSEEGREILKSLGIEGDYEGIGHCILGYADGEEPEAAQRKADYVYYVR